MSKYAFAAAAALSALIASSAAMAGKTQTILSTDTGGLGKFTVSVEITKSCQITSTGGNVTFDVSGKTGLSATKPSDANSTATITCTSGTEYDVYLTSDNGFRMDYAVTAADSTVTHNYIGYTVTSTLGSKTMSYSGTVADANKVSNVGTGQAQNVPMAFSINNGSWVSTNPVGTYSDQLTLNVNF